MEMNVLRIGAVVAAIAVAAVTTVPAWASADHTTVVHFDLAQHQQPENITLEPNALTVMAIRPARLGSSDSVVRRMEIPHGRFVRRIALAGAHFRLGDTRYLNGCLEVRLVRAGLGAPGENRGQE